MIQMRSELYRISRNGGALISPMFTQLGYTEWVQAPQDLQSVMFGQSIKVDLVFSQFTNEKEVRFQPGTKWVNLNTMEIISIPSVQPQFGIMMKTGIEDPVNMFQAQESIIVMQDAKAAGIRLIEDLRHVPLQISIALGDASTAIGTIYIEEGPSAQNKTQNYQVTATPNRITFLNETDRTVISSNISQIGSVTVSFLE
jgi:hypothetical protein